MAQVSVFNAVLVGFDHFERVDRVTSARRWFPALQHRTNRRGFPAHSLAVAGFAMDQLSVEVENNQVIRGKQEDDGARLSAPWHRARQFIRTFVWPRAC